MEDFIARFNGVIKDIDCMLGRKKGLIAAPDERIEGAGIFLAKKKDIVDGLDKSKKIDAICLTSIGRGTLFELNKDLRIVDRPIARLNASVTLDKKARSDANCLPDRRKSLFLKPKKRSKGARESRERRYLINHIG